MKIYLVALVVYLIAIVTSGQSRDIGIVILNGEEINVYQKDANSILANSSVLQVNNSSETMVLYDDVRLSPDGKQLFTIDSQLTEKLVSVIDTNSGATKTIVIPSQSGEFFTGQWSPDGTYLTVTDFASRDFFLVNTRNGRVSKVPNGNMGGQIGWTSDNSTLIFRGTIDCEGCMLRSALYSLDITTMNIDLLLDPNQLDLGINDWMSPVILGQFQIHDDTIYFEVSELQEESSRTNLYSFNTDTSQLRQMNLDSLFPENTLGTTIRNIWYSKDANRLTVLVFFDANPGSGWGIANWNLEESPKVTYEKLFEDDTRDIQLIASSAVSPNGQQIVIAAVDPTRQTSGSVTVVDVTTGQEVWYERFDQPVCQIEMPTDELVIYGLVAGRCANLSNVAKSVNTVSTYNLSTQEQIVLIESETSVVFVTPEQ